MRHLTTRWAAVALVFAALVGCGSDDPYVVVLPPQLVPPVELPTGTSPVTVSSLSPTEFAALAPVVKVGKVDVTNDATTVYFSIATTAGDNPIVGFGSTAKSATATVASYPNLAFALAKLVPGVSGSPDRWVSYIVTTVPTTTATAATPTRPSTDNTGNLVDNGNGTYAYTFYRNIAAIKSQVEAMTVSGSNVKADLGDLSYDANLAHRLTIQVSGNAPGTGTNTADAVQVVPGVPMTNPVNYIYNFIPATGTAVTAADMGREVVATANCDTCHIKLGGVPGLSETADSAGFHGGSRNDVAYCVVCHTEQRKYGRTEAAFNATNTFTTTTYKLYGYAVGNLPNYIHKIHQGGILAMKNYDYGGVKPNETAYPQDIRNCTKCHDGSSTAPVKTAQGDNWFNKPNALACGACHDGINFATGKGVTLADAGKGLTSTTVYPGGLAHPPGSLADDTTCAICHKPAAIDVAHLPVTPPSPNNALLPLPEGTNANTNAGWIASNQNRLPAGAIKVAYEIKSVSRNASKKPVMVFRLMQNGVSAPLDNFATATANPATGQKEIWPGFMGAPSVYFVYAVPQDGIAAPADFNASASVYLRSLWNGSAGGANTLTGPDPEGYYTATLGGTTIPDNAVMLTGGLGYSYNNRSTLPLTQTNLPDYPTAPSTVPVGPGGLTAGMPNATGGLIVIAPNKQVVATGYTPRRVIVADAKCNACHQELGAFTEDAFHAGQRNDGTTCSWCHTPNRTSSGWSADSTAFVHGIHAAAKRGSTNKYTWHAISPTEGFWEVTYPAILSQCEVCHQPGTYDFSAPTSAAAAPNRQYRYVATGNFPANGESITAYALNATKDACVASATPAVGTPTSAFSLSPNVVPSTAAAVTNYGIPFSFNAGGSASPGCRSDGTFYTVPAGTSIAADPTTLVISPTTAVCSACHVTPLALSHMNAMNGSFYDARGAGVKPTSKLETCELCHNPGGVADIKTVHATK